MSKCKIRFGFLAILTALAAASLWAGGGRDVLRGREISIGHWWAPYDVNTAQPTDEVGEMTLEWRRRLQREHGVTIQERQVAAWNEMLETIVVSIMAGRPAANSFIVMEDWAVALHRQGLLAALSDSKAVDLTTSTVIPNRQAAYNQEVRNTFTFGGKQYALTFGYGSSRQSVGLYFNKRLFREAGIDPDLPYNAQRDGTWNWNLFLDISKRLTRDRSNSGRVDTWAMANDPAIELLEAFAFANGAEFVGKDAQGRFTNATGRPEFLEALNFLRRLDSEGTLMQRPEGAHWEWYIPMFTDGYVAMLVEREYWVDTLMTMSDDWGHVLTPKGPRLNTYRFPTREHVTVVPYVYSGDDLDAILSALNLWNMPVTDDWKAGLWRFYRDTRAIDETMTMVRGPGGFGRLKNHTMIPGLQAGDIAWHIFWWTDDPAQLVERVSQNWNALIGDANAAVR